MNTLTFPILLLLPLATAIVVWLRPAREAKHVALIGSLATALWASLYLIAGSRFEERDLLRRFGADYAAYRDRVPGLVPWRLFFRRKQ